MELDELKNTWAALDNRLKENNSLNETIIMKMAQGKVEKSINKILIEEIIGTIILFLVLPFIAYSFETQHEKMKLFGNVAIIVSGITCFFAIPWEIYKISILMKIDFSKEINSTIYHFNKYQIQLKREFFIMRYFVVPILFMLGILSYAEANASFSLWMFLTCIFLLAAFIIWYSKKKYKKMHESILSSLEEIRELKEE
jgi:hypothetical protein